MYPLDLCQELFNGFGEYFPFDIDPMGKRSILLSAFFLLLVVAFYADFSKI